MSPDTLASGVVTAPPVPVVPVVPPVVPVVPPVVPVVFVAGADAVVPVAVASLTAAVVSVGAAAGALVVLVACTATVAVGAIAVAVGSVVPHADAAALSSSAMIMTTGNLIRFFTEVSSFGTCKFVAVRFSTGPFSHVEPHHVQPCIARGSMRRMQSIAICLTSAL